MTGPEDMKYRLGGLWFSSHAAIAQHCRKIIDESPGLSFIERVNDKHTPFLLDLIHRHPNFEEKWGAGVDHFVVHPGRKGLAFMRTNGLQEIFSFLKCATGRDFTPIALFTQACRWAIRDSIVEFRDAQFPFGTPRIPCAISGELVTLDDCHIDHADPPFRDIVKSYCAENDWEAMELVDGMGKKFAEDEDADRFRAFHDLRAKLQVTTKKENLKKR